MTYTIDELYANHADSVYQYIFLLVRKKEVAEDLTQETFIKVFRNLHQFNDEARVTTWIIQIAKNTTYDYFRKTKWTHLFSEKHDVNSSITPSTEQTVINKTSVQELYDALKTLKREYQEVVILRKINQLTIKETAIVLGWTENKVKAKLARALKKLQAEMLKQEVLLDGKTKRA